MQNAPTGNAGAAPAADASQASSASTNPAGASQRPSGSISDRISQRAEQLSQPPGAATDPLAAPQDKTQVDQAKQGQDPAQDAQKPEAEKAKPRTIPEAAFKQRLAESQKRIDTARNEAQAAKLEAMQARAAAQLLQAQLDEIRQQHAEGLPFDPKDDEIRVHKVTEEARKRNAELQREHAANLQKMNDEARASARREQSREALSNEIDGAIGKFPGISRVELIARMTNAAKRKQAASAEQIAKQLHDEFLVNARQVLGVSSEQPVTPTTARQPGARSTTRLPNNTKGYEAFINSMQR